MQRIVQRALFAPAAILPPKRNSSVNRQRLANRWGLLGPSWARIPPPPLSGAEVRRCTELDRHSSDALLATDAATRDVVSVARFAAEGHLALHATVLAENRASIAMLRHAGFVSRSVTPPARSTALAARRENP